MKFIFLYQSPCLQQQLHHRHHLPSSHLLSQLFAAVVVVFRPAGLLRTTTIWLAAMEHSNAGHQQKLVQTKHFIFKF
jgi:predicted NodU family carbamoyl transferase